ncbi:glycogen debranching protein GlgX [Mycobacterium sp.]|uniref:glycogen debranching protein GlgX n=1 Tax=Mycobacterium sp. TaxID=1785 RepID=UPI003D0CE1C8
MPEPLAQKTTKVLGDGAHFPLGATVSAQGVNFAVQSKTAAAAYVLLFDTPDGAATDIIEMTHRDRDVWHVFVHGLRPGQLYNYKMGGDYAPGLGLRFNAAKLLLDPYAKAVAGKFRNADNLLLGYDPNAGGQDLVADARDDTAVVPKAVVIDDAFDWQETTSPTLDLAELIIYETHLKGFTAHPSSGVEPPGTYLGFIEKIPHLTRLGVNAVELLPVHEHYVDDFLCDEGLTNYWGYNSIGFFAPESSYATGRSPGCQVTEFKTLVRELHRAGIKVILDVVYNHTGEGNEMGPTLSFRGLDNPSYYSLTGPADASWRYYMNYSGCGNSLRFDSPAVIRLAMDSLRYWVEVMRVDGFRFDLASVLGRDDSGGFTSSAPFFDAAAQDPVLNRHRTILIAEPWDTGTFQVGNFPVDWSEWNGKFRDTVRKFGKGDAGLVPDLAARLTGSADLYGDDGRSASNSINFVTCHDGFTLYDLVGYNEKHNQLNGEGNQDGSTNNNSWNCGAEGDTDDPTVLALRRQQMKNFACYLLLAAGTPMILGGDEFARTQRGNNNAYCQDNEVSWHDWDQAQRNHDLVDFFGKLIAFTRRFPILQQRKFFQGKDLDHDGIADLTWFSPDLGPPDWNNAELRTLCYQLDAAGDRADIAATRLYIILNAHYESQDFSLPPLPQGTAWYRAIDTGLPAGEDFAAVGTEVPIEPAGHYLANARTTVVLLAK